MNTGPDIIICIIEFIFLKPFSVKSQTRQNTDFETRFQTIKLETAWTIKVLISQENTGFCPFINIRQLNPDFRVKAVNGYFG